LLLFSDNISQRSVATYLRSGGIFDDSFITNLLLSLSVKEFKKIGGHYWAKFCI